MDTQPPEEEQNKSPLRIKGSAKDAYESAQRGEDEGLEFVGGDPDVKPDVSWGDIDMLTLDRTRLTLVGVGILVVLLIGFFAAPKIAALSLVLALVLSSSLARAVKALQTRGVPPLYAALGSFVGVMAIVWIFLLVLAPAWKGQADTYADNLSQLGPKVSATLASGDDAPADGTNTTSAVSNSVDSAISDTNVSATATNTTDEVEGTNRVDRTVSQAKDMVNKGLEAGKRHAVTGANWLDKRLVDAGAFIKATTTRINAQRTGLFLQLALFLAALLALPLLRQDESDEKPNIFIGILRSAYELFVKISAKIAFVCSSFLAKGLVLGILAGICFDVAGLPAPMFLGANVFVLTSIVRFGGILGVLIALPMVLFAEDLPWAAGGLVVSWLVLLFAERQLHWHLYQLPTLRAGGVPAGMVSGPGRARPRVQLNMFGLFVRLFRIAFSLAFIGAIVWLGYALVPQYLEDDELNDRLYDAAAMIDNGDLDDAKAAFDEMLEERPDDRRIILGQLKAAVAQEEHDLASELAANIADPREEDDIDKLPLKRRIYRKAREVIGQDDAFVYPARGYHYIATNTDPLQDTWSYINDAADRALRDLPKDLPLLRASAQAKMLGNDLDGALIQAEKALKLDPDGKGWWAIIAEVKMVDHDFAGAIEAAEKELEIDPDNETMKSVKANSEAMKKSRENPPGAGQPAPDQPAPDATGEQP